MRHNRTLAAFAFLLASATTHAQIPNSGFEDLNGFDNIDHWGKTYMFSVWIDSSGESHSDSVVYDNQLYFQTTDAHSGQYAMEMRNGYNYTTQTGLAGGAFLFEEETYALSFAPVIAVDPIQPEVFSFYYKYYPLVSDSATATLTVYDSIGMPIGEAFIAIGGTVDTYTLANVPIVYTEPGMVHFISLGFSTTINGLSPTFGTRFLVDDVSLEGSLGVPESEQVSMTIYPNPAEDFFTVKTPEPAKMIRVTDASGKELAVTGNTTIDCGSWQPGVYFLIVEMERGSVTQLLVVD